MKFQRKQDIDLQITPKRVLIIYGPRRIGKTTLLEAYLHNYQQKHPSKKIFYATGDDLRIRELFTSQDRKALLDFALGLEVIAIDEAQSIPYIGLGIKMIIDAFPEKIIILTGSSSFDLANQIGEPLTGRHFTMTLLPLSQMEITSIRYELEGAVSDFLIYGSYPEVLLEPDKSKKIKILNELVSSYLFKDALTLDKIKSPDLLKDIVKCLSFQVGKEVSLNEIANIVKTDVKTVGRYIDVLEKMFIIKKVRAFSRNLRNEIAKKAKYYFLDNGVRNAVISQFNNLGLRNDIGALWENFILMELFKSSNIKESSDNYYFWRTHSGQEIDIIKESNGILTAIECKWSPTKISAPKLWQTTYSDASFMVLHPKNYLQYLES